MKKNTRSWLIDLGWLTLLLTAFYFLFLGIPTITTPDEARYAEIPREMLAMHQYIIPYLNGVIYFEKPPLSYWIVAGFQKLFGYSAWAVRSPVAVLGILGCLATYGTARQLFNRRTGILSALILSTSLLYFIMGHYNTTDMPVTFCLTLCLYSFLLALQTSEPKRKWLWCSYAFAGLAMMAKGLIGIAFPGVALLIWLGFTKRWQLFKKIHLVSGLIIVSAINFPWLYLAEKHVHGFLYYYFVVQQFLRYATNHADRHMNLALYFFIVLFSTFPWFVYIPNALKSTLKILKEKANSSLLLLIIWPTFIIIFFSFSHSILIPYLLPITPPLAILLGNYFDASIAKKAKQPLKIPAIILATLYFVIALGFSGYLYFSHIDNIFCKVLVLALLFSSIIVLLSLKSTKRLLLATFITGALALLSIWLVVCNLNHRSIKSLAITINKLMKKNPNARIIDYGFYKQDLPYYTKHLVSVVSGFGELTYGIELDKNKTRFIQNDKALDVLWKSNQRLYVVLDQSQYELLKKGVSSKIYLIQKDNYHHLLVTNKPFSLN